jgi:predicted GNAT family acetyltransferase
VAPPGEVRDDRDRERFVLDADGAQARLDYRSAPGTLVLVHTEVPDALEGRGIGGRLVQAAVDRAEAERRTVVPWCPFARRWLQRHPEEAARVTIDWTEPPGPTRGSGSS